jgi:hypothetical protein
MSKRRRAMMLGLGSVLTVAVVVTGALLHILPTRGSAPVRAAAAARTKRVTVARQKPSILTHPTALPSPAWTTVAASGGGPGAPVANLSELTPVQVFNVSKVSAGPVRIGTTTYTDSVRFTCDSGGHDSAGDLDYVVTGYGSMSALLGVPSDDTGATGGAMTVSFFNNGTGAQTSDPVVVSLGHPQNVHVRFSGSSQLEISCSAVSSATKSARYMELALGNATIGPG